MRFGVPRSSSPSPVRGKMRRSTYGLHSDLDEFDDDPFNNSDSSDESESSSSSEQEYSSDSDYEPSPRMKPMRSLRSPEEWRKTEETIASIRLRTRHHDPYEEWEKQIRKEAFTTARKEQSTSISQLRETRGRLRSEEAKRLAVQHVKEMADVQAKLNSFRIHQQNEEKRLRDAHELRQKQLWTRIESVIKMEENKVAKRLAEEQRKREEEEAKRREEELKARLADEKRRMAEEQKRREEEEKIRLDEEKKRLEEEQKRLAEEAKRKEEEERKLQEEEEQQKQERLKAEKQQRQQVGLTTPDQDWREARTILKHLKSEAMAAVKANKEMKAEWGKGRRQITPKVGQLTDDPTAINRISQQLLEIIRPPTGAHHPAIYVALLSSLAKSILLQAETEVTAEKRSAGPLAQVTFNLLSALPNFPEVFFAKLVQRVGGWPVPSGISPKDIDGREWSGQPERLKVMGYRKSQNGDDLESIGEYTTRVAGIMRVYFAILKIPPAQGPLKPMFQLPRYWTWFARLLGERALLETAVAAQLIYTALDVMGHQALVIWGQQWVKMLALLYEGVTVGLGGGKTIGGDSPEGRAARVRVQMEIEKIMAGARSIASGSALFS